MFDGSAGGVCQGTCLGNAAAGGAALSLLCRVLMSGPLCKMHYAFIVNCHPGEARRRLRFSFFSYPAGSYDRVGPAQRHSKERALDHEVVVVCYMIGTIDDCSCTGSCREIQGRSSSCSVR